MNRRMFPVNAMMPRAIAAFVSAMLLSVMTCSVMAQNVTVDFSGYLSESSGGGGGGGGGGGDVCTPSIQQQLLPGSNNTANTVTLPPVDVVHLDAAGKTWGDVEIAFRASGICTVGYSRMWVNFISSNVDDYGLIIPNNSSQIGFEIFDNYTEDRVEVDSYDYNHSGAPGSWLGGTSSFIGSGSNRRSTRRYIIRWYAQTAVTQAGNYSANVTAKFIYY